MRRTRYRWMWGLPVVAVIWLLSVIVVQQDIRLDLKVRAEQSLRQAGLGWAAVAVDGRDARLIGEAYSEQERGLARRILAKTWGVANVTDGSRLAEAVPNYVWTAEVNGAAIKLTGYFPSQTMRRRIVQAARDVFPKFQVADRMRPRPRRAGRRRVDGWN